MALPWFRLLVAGLLQWRLGFDPRPVRVGFVVDKVALGRVFLPVFWVFALSYHTTNSPRSSSAICCSYQKDKRTNFASLSKNNALSEIEENLVEIVSTFLFLKRHFTYGKDWTLVPSLSSTALCYTDCIASPLYTWCILVLRSPNFFLGNGSR